MLNLLVASLAGITALLLYEEFGRIRRLRVDLADGRYLPICRGISQGLAAICFLHLRGIGRTRLWLKGGIVTTLLAIAISAQALQRSEAFSDLGRQTTTRLLMPPGSPRCSGT